MKSRVIHLDILYNGIDASMDIADVMSDFEYSDATEESDSISITLGDPDGKWADAWMPENGDQICAKIRRENWTEEGQVEVFSCGNFVVDSFRLSSPPPVLVVEGVSSPVNQEFKETKRTQTWEKVTIRQVAAEIAGRYSLALIYDTVQDITLEREEQNDKADSTYLQELCNKYGLGIKVYADQIVIWSYEEYEKKEPVLAIRPDMVSKWSYKGSIQGTYTGAKVSYADPQKDEVVETFVGAEGRILTVNEKAESIADAERIGENALRAANRKEITMDISFIPSVFLAASSVVTLEGFGKMDGNFFITNVRHRISRGAYSVQLSVYRLNEQKNTAGTGTEEAAAAGTVYEVKKGDTLWDLAGSFYGDSTKYTVIYDANRDVIEAEATRRGKGSSNSGYWIFPGTILTIPAG